MTYVFSHYYATIKVDAYDSLPIGKRLTLHNVIILCQFLIKIEIFTTILNLQKNVRINQLNNNCIKIFDSVIMPRLAETKTVKEISYAAEKPINICDFSVDDMIISK